jgi:hypothetical protein
MIITPLKVLGKMIAHITIKRIYYETLAKLEGNEAIRLGIILAYKELIDE